MLHSTSTEFQTVGLNFFSLMCGTENRWGLHTSNPKRPTQVLHLTVIFVGQLLLLLSEKQTMLEVM